MRTTNRCRPGAASSVLHELPHQQHGDQPAAQFACTDKALQRQTVGEPVRCSLQMTGDPVYPSQWGGMLRGY